MRIVRLLTDLRVRLSNRYFSKHLYLFCCRIRQLHLRDTDCWTCPDSPGLRLHSWPHCNDKDCRFCMP